jgi:hypothetical protein
MLGWSVSGGDGGFENLFGIPQEGVHEMLFGRKMEKFRILRVAHRRDAEARRRQKNSKAKPETLSRQRARRNFY